MEKVLRVRARSIFGVVPALNEGRTISLVVDGFRRYCEEVVVVDDGSQDDTARIAENAGASVLRIPSSMGYSHAVGRGFELALDRGAHCVVTADGDCAHILEDLQKLVKGHLASGAALTLGSRFSNVGLGVASTKVLANRVAASLVADLVQESQTPPDVATGFRVYDAEFAAKFLPLAFELPPFGLCYAAIVSALREGLPIHAESTAVRYDASQLLYTRRTEFNDLISTLILLNHDRREGRFARLKEGVERLHRLRFVLPNRVIYGIPLKEVDGYIFQEQNEVHDRIATVENDDCVEHVSGGVA